MEITVTLPTAQSTDARYTVTLRESGTPWPIRLHFLSVAEVESGPGEFLNIGFELGEPFPVKPGVAATQVERTPESIDAVTLQRIAENYGTYLQLAQNALILQREGIDGAIRRLRDPKRTSSRPPADFYRLFAADYKALRQTSQAPGRELAAKYNVHPATISKWLSRARRLGALDETQEEQT